MVAGVDPAIDCADLRARLSTALKAAMRARDQVAIAALRSALAAIGNAEAVPADEHAARVAPGQGGPHFAGAAVGLGAGETARRLLSPADLAAIMRTELSDREAAADHYAASGFADQAERLRREASVLESVMLPADHD
jgi:uncharacterized protein